MPIEFRCSRCGKLLRTGDGTAGRQAQCPECGTIGTVPGPAEPQEPVARRWRRLGTKRRTGGRRLPPAAPLAPAAAPAGAAEAPYQPAGPFGYQLPPDSLRRCGPAGLGAGHRAAGGRLAGHDPVGAVVALDASSACVVVASGVHCKTAAPMRGDEQAQAIVGCSVYSGRGDRLARRWGS